MIVAVLAAAFLTLQPNTAWGATSSVTLIDSDDPKSVVEEDRYRLRYKVLEAKSDHYIVEVSSMMTESIDGDLVIPSAPDNKPFVYQESWGKDGSFLLDEAAEKRELQRQRIERILHPPLESLTLGNMVENHSKEDPIRWTLESASRAGGLNRFVVRFEEKRNSEPITARETLIVDPKTGLTQVSDAMLYNVLPMGGEIRMTMRIHFQVEKTHPTRGG